MFKQKTLPLLLVLLMVGHLALPFADASSTSGRAGPDFQVNNMLFDGAGSVFTSSGLVLAPDTHTVRVVVENVGTSSGNAFLSLVHKGSPSAAEQIVDTVDLGTMPASSGPTTFLLSWTATTGPQQTLFARVSGANDGNPVNNEYRRDFDVDTLREMTILPAMSSHHLLRVTPMSSLTGSRTPSTQQFATTVSCRPQRLWGSFCSMHQRLRQLSIGKHQTQKQLNQVQSIHHLQAKSSALVFQQLP